MTTIGTLFLTNVWLVGRRQIVPLPILILAERTEMPIIRHEWKGIDFGRVIGGLAWPTEKAGFAVVVGEDRFPAIGTKDYHCYLIAEVEEQSLQVLISWCVELGAVYNVENFYGRQHQPCMRYLSAR